MMEIQDDYEHRRGFPIREKKKIDVMPIKADTLYPPEFKEFSENYFGVDITGPQESLYKAILKKNRMSIFIPTRGGKKTLYKIFEKYLKDHGKK